EPSPEPKDLPDVEPLARHLDQIRPLAVDAQRAVHGAGSHELLAEVDRLVEQGDHVPGRDVDALLVPLEAQDLVAIDAQREIVEDDGDGREDARRSDHRLRREWAISAMSRMCSGPEPQQAPTILQPTSSSAG